jgi:5-methylcytosine-specific restriction endonuclease McrA
LKLLIEHQARKSRTTWRALLMKSPANAQITQDKLLGRALVYDGLCAYYHQKPFENFDHLIPVCRGGPNILSNLRPCCKSCNMRKGKMPAKQWLASLYK